MRFFVFTLHSASYTLHCIYSRLDLLYIIIYNYPIMKKILVVGSQNTCRSIITAEYLKKALKDMGNTDIEVSGAGIMAFPDIPADEAAAGNLNKLNIQGEFKSRPLSKQEVVDATLILTMSAKIKAAISGKFADKAAAIFTLHEIAGEPEADITASDKLGDEIKAMIDKGMDKILK
jgi:protein-tyrosine-phosphatase